MCDKKYFMPYCLLRIQTEADREKYRYGVQL